MKRLFVLAVAAAVMWQSSAYALTTLWDTSAGMFGLGLAASIPGDSTGEQTSYGRFILDDFTVGAPGWVVKRVVAYGVHDRLREVDQLLP
ncbi:MAG: hypothetical protein RMM06_11025, partial [Armatimonadota bacterium]|nr:hypothetical protein [Armatimonadota bacterium]